MESDNIQMYELTELEKKVILTLSERGPMSGYDFHLGGKRQRGPRKALMSSGSWNEIKKSLGPKGLRLIEPVKLRGSYSEDERGRRKDLYWLTVDGIFLALAYGANPEVLREHYQKVYGSDEYISFLFDLAKNLADDTKAKAFPRIYAMFDKTKGGKLELRGIPLSLEEAEIFVKIIRKYPSVRKNVRKKLLKISPLLAEVFKL